MDLIIICSKYESLQVVLQAVHPSGTCVPNAELTLAKEGAAPALKQAMRMYDAASGCWPGSNMFELLFCEMVSDIARIDR